MPLYINKTGINLENRRILVWDHMSYAHGAMANLRFNPSSLKGWLFVETN